MKTLKVPRSVQKIFIVFSLFFLASVILFYSLQNQATNNNSSPLLINDQHDLGARKLKRILQRATMPDRTVILTIISRGWAKPGSLFDIYLEGFKVGQGTERFLNHLVVLTVDDQAFEYCRLKHHHCFNLANYRFNYETWKPFRNLQHLKLGWRKIEAIGDILYLGYRTLYTNADVLWLRNPFQHFDGESEIITSSDPYNPGKGLNDTNIPERGFLFCRSNAASLEFFKYWKMARILRPNSSERLAFSTIKDDGFARGIGLRIRYLDTDYFGSLCEENKDMGKLWAVDAKCYNTTERKVHYLRRALGELKN